MRINDPRTRQRAVKGWAFENLPEFENEQIRRFLVSGRVEDLPEYRRSYVMKFATGELK